MGPTLLDGVASALADESRAKPFDCVVVGAGSSGLTVALTLAEAGKRVAVLEGGPAPLLTHISNTELRFSSELTRNLRDQVSYSPTLANGDPFGRNYGCFGGRGLFWNGAAPRFRVHDFIGWPLNAGDLADAYHWAEQEFRVTRVLGTSLLAERLIRALSSAGFGAEPGPFAVDLDDLKHTGRLSAGIASGLAPFYRCAGDAVAKGQIRVAVQTLAEQLLLDKEDIAGVLARTGDGPPHEIRARTVALAGGGIESIRLASVSGVPDRHGRIGLGIQDHIFYRCYFEGPALYRDLTTPQSAVVYVPSTTQSTEQWEIHAPGRRLFTLDDGKEWQPQNGEDYHVMIRAFAPTEKRDANWVEAQPGPRGSATIHFEYSDADLERQVAIQSQALRLGEAAGLALVEDRLSNPGGSYHEAGGLDMGTDPATSVTDPDGRFHHCPNLLCVDAAAFPQIGATNPHLTILALARRKAMALAKALS